MAKLGHLAFVAVWRAMAASPVDRAENPGSWASSKEGSGDRGRDLVAVEYITEGARQNPRPPQPQHCP